MALVASTAIALTLTGGAAGAAAVTAAAPTPTPTSSASPESSTYSISAPEFSPTNAVKLTGSKESGASIAIYVNRSSVAALTIPADQKTTWKDTIVLANGAGTTLDAVETQNGVASTATRTIIDVLGAPSIDGQPDSVTSGLVAGYAVPGATIAVNATPARSDSALKAGGCRSSTTTDGYWSCALDVASGAFVVQATQSHPEIGGGKSSSLSGSVELIVDKDAPAKPAITSPSPGSTVGGTSGGARVVVGGTGETRGVVDLYVDNIPICQAAVRNSAWTCTISGISAGNHTLVVIQRDAAGNYSSPSAGFSVTFGSAASITPTPPSKPGTPSAPAKPSPSAKPGIPLPINPKPTPSDTAPPATPLPGTPPPSSGGTPPTIAPYGAQNNWGTPTLFGLNLPTLATSVTTTNWAMAAALALLFVFLVALPLRMLATTLSGRIRPPRLQLTGRNQSRYELSSFGGGSFGGGGALVGTSGGSSFARSAPGRFGSQSGAPMADTSTPLNPWLAGSVPIMTVAALIVLSGGVSGEVRYLRLSLAVIIGLSILNVVGVAIAVRFGYWRTGISARLRFLPVLMVVAVAAAIASRFVGLEPPIVAGVLIGVSFAASISPRDQAVVSIYEIGAVTILATLAWIGHSLVLGWNGFAGALVQESLATVALAGFGSAIVLVLPIATLPGRALFDWSRPLWLSIVVIVASLGSAVVLGATTFPVLGAVSLAAGFAMLCVAVWAWFRFVEPAMIDSGS